MSTIVSLIEEESSLTKRLEKLVYGSIEIRENDDRKFIITFLIGRHPTFYVDFYKHKNHVFTSINILFRKIVISKAFILCCYTTNKTKFFTFCVVSPQK